MYICKRADVSHDELFLFLFMRVGILFVFEPRVICIQTHGGGVHIKY